MDNVISLVSRGCNYAYEKIIFLVLSRIQIISIGIFHPTEVGRAESIPRI